MKRFLFALVLWCLLMQGYELAALCLLGKPPVGIAEFFKETSGLLFLGVPITALLSVACRKWPGAIGIVISSVSGLTLPPALGLSIGLMHETFGYSARFPSNAIEGWIVGLVSAVPSAIAAAIIASVEVRHLRPTLPDAPAQ